MDTDSEIPADRFYEIIEKDPHINLSRRASLLLIDQPFIVVPVFKNFSLNDQKLSRHVYKRSLECILHPLSNHGPHNMEAFSGTSLGHCFECDGFLWSIGDEVLRCTKCGLKAHRKCKEFLYDDCTPQDNSSSDDDDGQIDEEEVMRKRIVDKKQILDTLRKIFNIDPSVHEKEIEDASKTKNYEVPSKWSARIIIRVICARGLMSKDSTSQSDPYVTIQIGKVKKKTKTIRDDNNPFLDETFHFQSQNSDDKIKIRVWDDDQDTKSGVRGFFGSVSDDFLGQKVIDIKMTIGQSDLWYILEKRGDNAAVSGSIRLEITTEVEGEEKIVPRHIEYLCLHENVFNYFKENVQIDEEFPETDDFKVYFDSNSQVIIDAFVDRYGIERVFILMMHFSCLCEIYSNPGIAAMLGKVLYKIRTIYDHTTLITSLTLDEQLTSSYFGKWKFLKILDQLNNCLRINLSLYRTLYPSSEPGRLQDLEDSVNLLINVNCFRNEIDDRPNPLKACHIAMDCLKECMETTYKYLFSRCSQIYDSNFESDGQFEALEEGPGCKRNFVFWHKLIILIASTIDEDVNFYSHIFSRIPQEFDMQDLSSSTLWKCFNVDLKDVLEEHLLESRCKSYEFVNFFIMVNGLHSKYICPKKRTIEPPEFPLYFEPFISRWLKESENASVTITISAYHRDKFDQFQRATQKSLFSNSVVDIFSQLNQCFSVIKILSETHPDVGSRYVLAFSMTIEKNLIMYYALIVQDFSLNVPKPETAFTFMNNIQEIRFQLENLFILMGGENLSKEVIDNLNKLQKKLHARLKTLASIFCESLRCSIAKKVIDVREVLTKQNMFHSSNPVENTKESVIDEANELISPLISYLDTNISTFVVHCDKNVLRKLLKELWKIVIEEFEYIVIVPPIPYRGQMCTKDEKVPKISHIYKTRLSLTPGQCLLLENAFNILKSFFSAGEDGLRLNYLEKSEIYKNLIDTLILSSQNTEVLIKVFIESQNNQVSENINEDDSVGHLFFEIELTSMETEYKLLVKVIEVTDIAWPPPFILFLPFVDVSVLGPHMRNRKRSYSTKTVCDSWTPKFNKTFNFFLEKESNLAFYELHFCLKDYYFIRSNKIVGVGVFQLKNCITKLDGVHQYIIPFKSLINFDDVGDKVLRILSQRNNEMAKEFVKLKTEMRHKF